MEECLEVPVLSIYLQKAQRYDFDPLMSTEACFNEIHITIRGHRSYRVTEDGKHQANKLYCYLEHYLTAIQHLAR